ncbi:MAG: GAF domain-containing protein [Anaerolineae bacterium]|nr:GAF domain-containing protein [Anaerolineae bacterium]
MTPQAFSVEQLFAWSLAILALILALYVSVLNIRNRGNAHLTVLMLVFAVNTLVLGVFWGAQRADEVSWAAPLVAMTSPAVLPLLGIVAVAFVKPEWFKTRMRYPLYVGYGLVLLPALLVGLDFLTGLNLYYTGLNPLRYMGGFVDVPEFTGGALGNVVRLVNMRIVPVLVMLTLIYLAFVDRGISVLRRRLARLLLVAQFLAFLLQVILPRLLPPGIPALLTIGQFIVIYAYVAFQALVSEGGLQGGRLRPRLTAMVLVISAPLLVGSIALISVNVNALLRQSALGQLESNSELLAYNITSWMDFNRKSLALLASRPEITSMNPNFQRPVLQDFAVTYPYMYLVSTTDLAGFNVARNDESDLLDYSDRQWYQQAVAGQPGLQTVIGRTSGVPALIMSEPIRDGSGEVVGVSMFASTLTDISDLLARYRVGDTGLAYLVGPQGLILASDLEFFTAQQTTILDYPPAAALMGGARGIYRFDDANAVRWQAYIAELENDWGLIIQVNEQELLAQVRSLRILSIAGVFVSALILMGLSWLAFRQAFRPVEELTAAVLDISAGNIDREAPVLSEDELGFLADAFNQMTARLRSLIAGLETQVADRTRDLEQRAAYLEAASTVSQAATSILDTESLLSQTVNLIRDHFGLYYVGLFLLDAAGEWAVLRAGTGEAGRAMMARGHRLRIGSRSMISWCIENSEARIALHAGEDAVRQATAELPETRSEAALPLRSRGRVLGALTVQHTREDVFDASAIAVLQTMVDQLAVALDNAELIAATQEALDATRRAYGEKSELGWQRVLSGRGGGYRYAYRTFSAVEDSWSSGMTEALQAGRSVIYREREPLTVGDVWRSTLVIPLRVRERIVGVLDFRKSGAEAVWLDDERLLLEAVVAELGQALESAQLYQETQSRAANERLIGEIASQLRQSLDVTTVLQTAVTQLGRLPGVAEATVHVTLPESPAAAAAEAAVAAEEVHL